MSAEGHIPPGWHPDPATGGTRYWNGARWLASRPKRRPFAAAGAHKGWGIGLLAFGVLAAVTSPGQIFSDEAGDTLLERTGSFLGVLLMGFVCTAVGLYLFRGQGPTNKAVQELAAQVAASERSMAHRDRARSVAPTPVPSSRTQPSTDAALVAQINAISKPETAQALQNLHNLLYTRVITEAEFRAAKDRLLGSP